MLRKVLVGLLVVAVLVSLVVGRMALTLNIGSGAIALVQSGPVVETNNQFAGGPVIPATLAAPSTAGTALVVLLANRTNPLPVSAITAAPAGFTRLSSKTETSGGTGTDFEVWVYLNNPGGISAANFTGGLANWISQMSEWTNVDRAAVAEASGTASATAGTTLAPTTTGNVLNATDVAISAWIQFTNISGTVTFTTPGGWTRLKDDGAVTQGGHLDAEYQLLPATGAPLGPTLTSTGTTVSASGAIIVLKAAPPVVDQTAYIAYGSLSVKKNTADFQLVDPATVPSLGDPVALTGPTWNGRIVSITKADIVDIASGHKLITIAATNDTAVGVTTAPGDFGDTAVGGYLLQGSGGKIMLEDGTGALLLEGTRFGYSGLSVQTSQNQDGTVTTYGTLTTFEPGYAAGQTFGLYSANLGYTGDSFTITNVYQTWIGAALTGQPTVGYVVEFGDTPQTMQTAGGGVLTQTGSTAAIQQGVAVPGGVLGYAAVTAAQTGITTATDLTGLSVTVTVVASRRLHVTGYVGLQQITGAAVHTLTIREGATVLATSTENLAINDVRTSMVAVVLTPTTGVHTYKLTLASTAASGQITASATAPSYLLVEDVGT